MEGNYPRVITRGTIIQSPIVRGEFCWMKLSGGSYAGTIIWWAIVRGTIILGDYCPGGNCVGNNHPGGYYPGAIALEPK